MRWVRIKIVRFGMRNESDRSLQWFDKNYQTIGAKVEALRDGTVVPLNQYRQPIGVKEAIEFLYEREGLSGTPPESWTEETDFGDVEPVDIDGEQEALRREVDRLRRIVQDMSVRGQVSSDIIDDSQQRRMHSDMIMPPRCRVFISYFREDLSIVERIHSALIEAGHDPWWDEDLLGGDEAESTIRRAIAQSDTVLLVLSQRGLERERSNVYPELYKALELHQKEVALSPSRTLVPVRVSDCQIPAVPVDGYRQLTDLTCIDLYPKEAWHRGMQKLIRTLERRSLSLSSRN